jgi:hypothetical protein
MSVLVPSKYERRALHRLTYSRGDKSNDPLMRVRHKHGRAEMDRFSPLLSRAEDLPSALQPLALKLLSLLIRCPVFTVKLRGASNIIRGE